MATSPILSQFLPVEIVASGGYVSLCALANRTTTRDLDYFIDPAAYGTLSARVQAELKRLITEVAGQLHFVSDWANDQVTLFLTLIRNPKELFDRSVQQGVLLFRGTNLHIYAVVWLWVLVRKMKRLQMEGQEPREVDWIDCVSIIQKMVEETGTPFSPGQLTEFDHTDREPPVFLETVAEVNHRFRSIHGFDGIAG
ncbi:MAG: hypothetical protein Q9203_004423 [Teloschistes exilis]